jgi:hypothetical protein
MYTNSMRVGILGDRDRAAAWEKHLRPLTAVQEVVITASLSDLDGMDACILLDDTTNNLHLLADSIRLGFHSYLVSPLPTDEVPLERIHRLAQESDVRVQFSHWPTISPSSQWMKQQLPKPSFIQIIKEDSHINFSENRLRFSHSWMDEIAFIVKWMGINTHKLEVKSFLPGTPEAGLHIFIKFENGSSAALFFLVSGNDNRHRRFASAPALLLDCDVDRQSVKKTVMKDNQRLSVESQTFDPAKSAGLSASLFFKAIKLKKETAYTAYDAVKTARVIRDIQNLLKVQV